MKLILKRYRIKPETCDGLLLIDGVHYCDTAEPTALMLPEGTYDVTFRKHPVHNHRAPYVQTPVPEPAEGSVPEPAEGSVPEPAEGYLIHGNGVFKAATGDILLGEYVCPGIVLRSRQYFDPLIKRLEKAFLRGTTVQLTIINRL